MRYRGITFGNKHSFTDYGLKPVKFSEALPEQRKESLTVPGMHGSLDLSKAITGYVTYENRELEYIFTLRAVTQDEFEKKIFPIRNELDGMEMRIANDCRPGFYFVGTPSVSGEFDPEDIDHEVTVTVDAEPFAYKADPTVVQATVSGEETIICNNARMEVIPVITCTAGCAVTFCGVRYALSAGEHLYPDILFRQGENRLVVAGTTTIKFEYQEGAF